MYTEFAPIPFFIVLSVGVVLFAFLLQKMIAPKNGSELSRSTYECGEEVEGNAWVQFNIRFYVIALIFLIFDVEVVLLVPWAVVFKELGWMAFIEMLIFLVVLSVGFVAVWRRRDLDWVKMVVPYAHGRYKSLEAEQD